jgi:hypothetical protein
MAQPSGYAALQRYICIELGFCGAVIDGELSHVDFLVPKSGPVSAGDFADLVFRAEGIVLESFRERICAAFTRFMGSDVVDAAALR